ncbi:MAG: hypothetical protein ACL7BU_02755 [Candidatus Phlomobacter fragariae]
MNVTLSINVADIQNPGVHDSNPVEKASLPEWSMPTYVSLNMERDEQNDVISHQQTK